MCNYAALKRALYQRYAPPGQTSRYAVELWQRNMRNQENAAEFGNALKKTCQASLSPSLVRRESIVWGLRDRDTKRHVHLARPQNVDEAIRLATEDDVFLMNSQALSC